MPLTADREEPQVTAAQPDLVLRPMTPDDLATAHSLSKGFQWPHRIEDWALFHSLGHGLIAERNSAPVGTILWWPWGEQAASIGMVMVDAAVQGGGIGRRLMAAVIAQNPGRSLILNATEAGEPLYRRLGFTPVGAIRQHQGAGFANGVPALPAGCRLRPVTRTDLAPLTTLDSAATGLSRPQLIAAFLDNAEGIALDRDGEIIGYALFRRFGRGHVIGPVAAPDLDAARVLIGHWIGLHPGLFIRIDVPVDCGLSPWLDDLGLTGLAPATSMTLGPPPATDPSIHSFAIAAQALG